MTYNSRWRLEKIMSRRELREHLFRMLFRKEFHNQTELNEQIDLYFNGLDQCPSDKDRNYLEDKFDRVIANMEAIDETIEAASSGWKLSRIGKVDLAILRLAVYEVEYDEDIPIGVAINEAVELAKKFGEDQSASFINGILAKVANK